jgi:hypothetical protein
LTWSAGIRSALKGLLQWCGFGWLGGLVGRARRSGRRWALLRNRFKKSRKETVDMSKPEFEQEGVFALSRRGALQRGAQVAGATVLASVGGVQWAFAADKPAMGTWPAGSQGDTVYVGAAVPLTGTYAVQGADELKGWELAVEHMNTDHPLMKKIAPKINKGVLGKKVALVSADSAAKPNQAVQSIQTFINQNKIILATGSTSSAVAVALNKFCDRENSSTCPASRARTTPPARTACATASARATSARWRPIPSARSC